MTKEPTALIVRVGEVGGNAGSAPWDFGMQAWRWDRRAELDDGEIAAVTALGAASLRRNRAVGTPRRTATSWKALSRLVEPLDTARAVLHHDDAPRFRRAGAHAAAIVLQHCADTGRSYWSWTTWDWARLCGASAEEFLAARTLPTE
ncbi:hypothetical protein ACWDKQ_23150 [Saccharopolyspora sp. NPDC000995]